MKKEAKMDDLPERIELPVIRFDSKTTDYILQLEILRGKSMQGSTPPEWFVQLKHAFMLLESLLSSRIEGNHTTIAKYAEKIAECRHHFSEVDSSEDFAEIKNIENAIDFIESWYMADSAALLNEAFLQKLHSIVVDGLTREGDSIQGYRTTPVYIQNSSHEPPEPESVPGQMRYFIEFINRTTEPKYDLLKIAVAHHRFVWIHPFANGNGRTARLLTYAMLLKAFSFRHSHIVNPTAVFCSNRQEYYRLLGQADSLSSGAICEWCDYMLKGLAQEIGKLQQLTDVNYVRGKIFGPMVSLAYRNGRITKDVASILNVAIEKEVFQASDIQPVFKETSSEISRRIRFMLDAGFIKKIRPDARKYCINLASPIFPTLFEVLQQEGFFKE